MIEIDYTEKTFFHLFSEGTDSDTLFHDDAEFASGMNAVALSVYKTGIEVLAFVIMDNHFHFVIHSDLRTTLQFVLKLTHIVKIRRRYFDEHIPVGHLKWKVKQIDDLEYLMTAVAYTLRNPLSCWHSRLEDYPWSSISLYYRGLETMEKYRTRCRRIRDMKVDEVRGIIGTKTVLPPEWLVTPENILWPGNYVRYSEVNELFKTYRNFNYRLSYIKKEQMERLVENESRIGVTDLEARQWAKEYCRVRFGRDDYSTLSVADRKLIGRDLYFKLGASKKQISRILHLVSES